MATRCSTVADVAAWASERKGWPVSHEEVKWAMAELRIGRYEEVPTGDEPDDDESERFLRELDRAGRWIGYGAAPVEPAPEVESQEEREIQAAIGKALEAFGSARPGIVWWETRASAAVRLGERGFPVVGAVEFGDFAGRGDGSAADDFSRRLSRAIEAGDLELLRSLEAEERSDVEADASDAGQLGLEASSAVQAGDWDLALRLVEQAASLERRYCDDPAWGPAVKLVRAAVERRA